MYVSRTSTSFLIMSDQTFSDFYKSLLELVKKFERKNVMLKMEEDIPLNMIRIFGEKTDSVSRAKNSLEDVVELANTTAEHHPYWALLYNSSLISKIILEKWDEDITKEDLSEILWLISELKNSCEKLEDKAIE
ncbi:hypothetical protein AAA799O18_00735 [Marine Group I thaumarchaeote SCGC AAA799-O18]|nr:hypothetical protein AAA799O18_00735 [Marine Group I thaumarchaeote SCGC AAA799-O18]